MVFQWEWENTVSQLGCLILVFNHPTRYTIIPFSICKNAILQALDGVEMTEEIVKKVMKEGKKEKTTDKKKRKDKKNLQHCNVLGKLDTGDVFRQPRFYFSNN